MNEGRIAQSNKAGTNHPQRNGTMPNRPARHFPLDRRKSTSTPPSCGETYNRSSRFTNIAHLIVLCLCVGVLTRVALHFFAQHQIEQSDKGAEIYSHSLTTLRAWASSLLCSNRLLSERLKSVLVTCPSAALPSSHLHSVGAPRANRAALSVFFYDPLTAGDARWRGDSETAEGAMSSELSIPARPHQLGEQWLEAEALQALYAARRNRLEGNIAKAKVIIEHAYSLSSNHPDILTEYGILIETFYDNVVEADGLYTKALRLDAHHSEALTRRARTSPLVEAIDNQMLAEINRKRETFLQIPRSDPGLRRAMRESYFQHVYHTVALEGNTMSLMQTRAILETRMAVAGKSIIEHNEILGMDAALRFLNQSLTQVGQLRLDDILAIHRRVMGFVDPMQAGEIRTHQVFVGSFVPTAPNLIDKELDELVAWLNDEDTLAIDPVELAALAHYKLVYIHPFSDGNGRTSRLLMNFILMQAGFPPVIIPVHERSRYYHALVKANEGDLRPFIRFIAEMTDRALEVKFHRNFKLYRHLFNL